MFSLSENCLFAATTDWPSNPAITSGTFSSQTGSSGHFHRQRKRKEEREKKLSVREFNWIGCFTGASQPKFAWLRDEADLDNRTHDNGSDGRRTSANALRGVGRQAGCQASINLQSHFPVPMMYYCTYLGKVVCMCRGCYLLIPT
jgi:hypothetical protein